jgi:hypothetical protein
LKSNGNIRRQVNRASIARRRAEVNLLRHTASFFI